MWPMGKGESPDYFLLDLLCSWEGQWTHSICKPLLLIWSRKWIPAETFILHTYDSLDVCHQFMIAEAWNDLQSYIKRLVYIHMFPLHYVGTWKGWSPSLTVTAAYRSDMFGFLLLSCKWISYIIILSAFVTIKRIIAKHNFNNTIVKKT